MARMLLVGLFVVIVSSGCGTNAAEAPAFPKMFGLNIPWNHFGKDVGAGAYDPTYFEKYFALAENNSQNVARFWLHCDGSRGGLEYSSDGLVAGISRTFGDDLKNLLAIAQKHHVVVQLALWSFDMCKNETKSYTHASLISNAAASKSYVEKALKPILRAVSEFPNVIVEAINEPEWCMTGRRGQQPFTKDTVDTIDMQRFVAMIAEGAHAEGRKVTVGSASLLWSSHAPEAAASLWDDESLQRAYASSTGNLDFYNVHYYDKMHRADWNHTDPMMFDVHHWLLDKPTVVAEMPAISDYYSVDEILNKSTSNGFEGVLFWAFNDADFPIDVALKPMQSFVKNAHTYTYESILAWLDAPASAPGASSAVTVVV